jgi:hypothetical protein
MSTDTVVPSAPTPAPVKRSVGFLLGVGIFFLPYIFAWFTLRKGYSTLARVVSFGWMALVVLFVISSQGHTPARGTQSASVSASNGSPSTPAAVVGASSAASESDWYYEQTTDQMRGETSYQASVASNNELDFAFPYSGGSRGRLTVRWDKKFGGNDVYLTMDKGQFICHSFTGGHVSAKFDNGPIKRFRCNEPSDGTTGVLFIEPASSFIADAKRSKKLVLEAEFFQEGMRQLEFDIAGLKWDHGGKAK